MKMLIICLIVGIAAWLGYSQYRESEERKVRVAEEAAKQVENAKKAAAAAEAANAPRKLPVATSQPPNRPSATPKPINGNDIKKAWGFDQTPLDNKPTRQNR